MALHGLIRKPRVDGLVLPGKASWTAGLLAGGRGTRPGRNEVGERVRKRGNSQHRTGRREASQEAGERQGGRNMTFRTT